MGMSSGRYSNNQDAPPFTGGFAIREEKNIHPPNNQYLQNNEGMQYPSNNQGYGGYGNYSQQNNSSYNQNDNSSRGFDDDEEYAEYGLNQIDIDENSDLIAIANQLMQSGDGSRGMDDQEDVSYLISGAVDNADRVEVYGDPREFYDQSNNSERGIFSNLAVKVVAGAAAWLAVNWYIKRQKKQGKKVSHPFAKKLVASIAVVVAIKMFKKRGEAKKKENKKLAEQAAAHSNKLLEEKKHELPSYDSNYSNNGNQPPYAKPNSYGGGQQAYCQQNYGQPPYGQQNYPGSQTGYGQSSYPAPQQGNGQPPYVQGGYGNNRGGNPGGFMGSGPNF